MALQMKMKRPVFMQINFFLQNLEQDEMEKKSNPVSFLLTKIPQKMNQSVK